jgi:hypothetical protein
MRKPREIAAAGVTAVLALSVASMLVGATSGSSAPGRSAEAQQATSRVDQHAYPRTFSFWKCSPANDVARRDMIIGPAYCDVAQMRRLNPKGLFLVFPGLFPGDGNKWSAGDIGGMNVTYGTGLWYWRPSHVWTDGGCDKVPGPVNLGCMREFDFDFDQLYNADGSQAFKSGKSGPRGWNLSDPTGKGTRELVAKFMAYTAKVSGLYTKGWDGIFSDNWICCLIGEGYVYGATLDTDRNGKVDDYAVLRRRWDDGLNEVGNRLRAYLPGKIVMGNGSWLPMKHKYYGTDPRGWLKSSNGTMVETIEDYYNSSAELLKIADRWLSFKDPKGQPRYILFNQNALTEKGARLEVPDGTDPNTPKHMLDAGAMRSMRWGLTLSLMAGAYYEIYLNYIHGTRWWYDEYDGGKGVRSRGYLGKPLGRAVMLRPGVWRRDFARGIALNNSTSNTATIDLKRAYKHLRGTQNPRLNNGKTVTKVVLPGHDGLILLNVARKR